MPVDFLTEEQERGYGQFIDDQTELELAQFFYLDTADWRLLATRRGDHNRLGFAVQLCAVRYLGVFPADLRTVPERVARFVARQLHCADLAAALARYHAGDMRWQHQAEIRTAGGYRDVNDGAATFPVVRLLYTRGWVRPERPSVLFDVALTWLLAHKVLLPGITVLARLVARVRDRVAERLWAELGRCLMPEQRAQLDSLLTVPVNSRTSRLDVLRTGPRRISGPALVQALARLEEVRALGVGHLDLSAIPATRLKVLAAYAITSKAQTLARMPDDRRAATLLAFARTLEVTACDDALDVLDLRLDALLKDAAKAHRLERLRTIRNVDKAALTLADMGSTLLHHVPQIPAAATTAQTVRAEEEAWIGEGMGQWTDTDVRAYLDRHREQLQAAIARVTLLARPPGETFQLELRAKYTTVRHFLPRLLRTIDFASARAGQALIEAFDFLKRIEGQKRPAMAEAPLAVVPASWRRHVASPGKPVDRAMYTLCVLEQLQLTLRRRDVFVPSSARWADPRAKLLQGAEWEASRATTCQTL
jgi:hypothetical protein